MRKDKERLFNEFLEYRKENYKIGALKEWLLTLNGEDFELMRECIYISTHSNALDILLEVMRIKIEKRINKLNKI